MSAPPARVIRLGGWWRLWVASTVAWVAAISFLVRRAAEEQEHKRELADFCAEIAQKAGRNTFDCFDGLPTDGPWIFAIKEHWLAAIALPLAFLAIGLTVAWVIAGFRQGRVG